MGNPDVVKPQPRNDVRWDLWSGGKGRLFLRGAEAGEVNGMKTRKEWNGACGMERMTKFEWSE